MSEHCEHRASRSDVSLFTIAAWYSLIVPFSVPVLWFIIPATTSRVDLPAMISFFVLLNTLALGVVSLFGIPRHGRKRILWKALIGIIASVVSGFFALVIWSMSYTFHG
jgi:hypothetical protein